ncbi:MAG: tRNA pseudouridine(55) synthase TruB [Spirochaetes bacterium]|nr:tRNA pseudouridine(55) synthase TruB [Spirochaetota bacterium]
MINELKREGILLFNKGKNKTSFQAINEKKKKINIKKIGHSGTLDSNATGLLVVGLGKSTKLLKYFIHKSKSYSAQIYFGLQTETDDSAGLVINRYNGFIDLKNIKNELKKFKGKIQQIPPDYSSIHVNGVRSYKLALKKIKPDLKARTVEIYNYKIISFKYPVLTVNINCSSGTYIRSLARDLGTFTGYFAYLFSLKRTKIDFFNIKKSYTIDEISHGDYKIISPFNACKDFIPIEIKEEFIEKLKNGVPVSENWFKKKQNIKKDNDLLYKIHFRKNLLAILKYNNGNFIYDLVY